MKEIEKYLQESIDNIRNDRDVTNTLLKDVMVYISGGVRPYLQHFIAIFAILLWKSTG